MKEILPYFGHDNDALVHPKCQALIASHGFAGYGRFWALNERVAASEQARLDLSKKVNRAGLAVRLQMTPDELEAFLNFLADEDECGLIHYVDGVVTTDRTTENLKQLLDSREAARARKDAKKASSANSATGSANSGESSANFPPKESKEKESKEKKSKEKKEEEFAGSAEAAPEKHPEPSPTPPDDFDPQPNPQPSPTSTLKIPANMKLSPKDLDELQARFGTRSQEALNKIGAIYAAKDYGYKNHWAGVKLWLAEHSSPFDWLDGKKQPKAELSPRQAEAAKPVPRADVFDQGVEAGKTQLSATTAKDFIRQAQAARRAPVDDFDPVAS